MPYLPQSANLILYGGIIHTMDAHDRPATAIALRDGRIVGVGTDDEIRALAGLGTVEESIAGNTVIPGLIDAHVHLLYTGRMLREIQLFDCRSIGDITTRVAAVAQSAEPGAWIIGRGWDESLLAEGRHPTRFDLDPVSHGHPVVIHRVWNKLVANTEAMQRAGVTAATPDPPADVPYSGSFERGSDGEPTGLFRDRAKDLITNHIPAPDAIDEVSSVAAACGAFNALGITCVSEPGLVASELRAFQRAAEDDRLTVRTDMFLAGWGFIPASQETTLKERILESGLFGGFGNDLLRVGGVKLLLDGGIGDRTARMFQPYANEPENRGVWVIDPGELPSIVRWTHDLGFSIDSHACGDEAQLRIVEAYSDAMQQNPQPQLRHRVHHAYFPTDQALHLMARHRIPAVVSDPFIATLGESFVLSLGESVASTAMPMRSYLDAGVPLAGSSDSPVSDYNPWIGMQAATVRQTVTGRVLGHSERISAQEALRSYTIGGAFALGRERQLGSLEPGKLADLVILDRDPLGIPVEELAMISPLATMLGGRWVFDRR